MKKLIKCVGFALLAATLFGVVGCQSSNPDNPGGRAMPKYVPWWAQTEG